MRRKHVVELEDFKTPAALLETQSASERFNITHSDVYLISYMHWITEVQVNFAVDFQLHNYLFLFGNPCCTHYFFSNQLCGKPVTLLASQTLINKQL